MSNYRKKPAVIQAHQWFKNGDHPDDGTSAGDDKYEGRVVRYFRRPDVPGTRQCSACGETFHAHGWIDTLEGGHIVCPGDWIITGVAGERHPCKPHIFTATYEPAESPVPAQVPDEKHAAAVKTLERCGYRYYDALSLGHYDWYLSKRPETAAVPDDVESICNAYDIGMQSTDCINQYEHGTREHYAFSLGVERRYQLEYIAAQSTAPAQVPDAVIAPDGCHEAAQAYADGWNDCRDRLVANDVSDAVLLKAYTTASGGEILSHSWRPIFLRYARIGIAAAQKKEDES